jgi:hypothetical protein
MLMIKDLPELDEVVRRYFFRGRATAGAERAAPPRGVACQRGSPLSAQGTCWWGGRTFRVDETALSSVRDSLPGNAGLLVPCAHYLRCVAAFLAVPSGSLVLRTCYEHEEVWQQLLRTWMLPNDDGFQAFLSPVEDMLLDRLTPSEALGLLPDLANRTSVVVIADRVCLEGPERAALVVDPASGSTFRVIPSEMWSVENNLSVANMGFAEFAASAGPDNVFRGFDPPESQGAVTEPRYTVELRWAGLVPPPGYRVEDYALSLPPVGVSVIWTCEYDSLVRGRNDIGAGLHCRNASASVRLASCPRCSGPCRSHAFCPEHAVRVPGIE